MKKILILFCTTVMIISGTAMEIKANSIALNPLQEFRDLVERTSYFNELNDEIEELDVEVTIELHDGSIRHTLSYRLNDKGEYERTFVVVGDGNLDILVAEIHSISEGQIIVVDVINDTTMKINSGRSLDCRTFYCTQTVEVWEWHYDGMCHAFIGQACDGLPFFPGYGIILYLGCQVGVIILCSYQKWRKCVAGFWNNVCPA